MIIIRFSWERLTQIADGELENVGLNFSRFAFLGRDSFNKVIVCARPSGTAASLFLNAQCCLITDW